MTFYYLEFNVRIISNDLIILCLHLNICPGRAKERQPVCLLSWQLLSMHAGRGAAVIINARVSLLVLWAVYRTHII
jgi:hypothetical protein